MKKSILLIVLFVLILSACLPEKRGLPDGWKQMEDGTYYELFYFEGMPCLHFSPGAVNSFEGGFTCDWSKWEGSGGG